MSLNARLSLVVVAVFVAVVGALALTSAAGRDTPAPVTGDAASELLVRADSHRLAQPDEPEAVFVEFLDFECESCRAAFPAVEQLREDYGDRVEFVVRYFPIPSHANAENAAVAVEAAAQQGAFEAMYARMFQTQAEWGERRESEAGRFRTFAQDLGLDMAAYDAAVADPDTLARVQRDLADGTALGVDGTPTFFLDGERLQPQSYDDLTESLDGALRD